MIEIINSTKKDGNMSLSYSTDGWDNKIAFFKKHNINNNLYLNSINKNVIFDTNYDNNYLTNIKLDRYVNADAIITQDDVFIYGLFGDCVPLIIYDTKNNVLALAHLGWVSTANDLHIKVINYLMEKYNSNPNDLEVYIGPSIKKWSYSIDKSKNINFKIKDEWRDYIIEDDETYKLDLCGYIINSLNRMNILNINENLVNSFTSDIYFSHHRSWKQNIPDGRFIYGGRIERG